MKLPGRSMRAQLDFDHNLEKLLSTKPVGLREANPHRVPTLKSFFSEWYGPHCGFGGNAGFQCLRVLIAVPKQQRKRQRGKGTERDDDNAIQEALMAFARGPVSQGGKRSRQRGRWPQKGSLL